MEHGRTFATDPNVAVVATHKDTAVFTITASRLFDPALIERVAGDLNLCNSAYKNLVIDLMHVRFMSSAMVGRLVMTWITCEGDGGRCVFCGVDPTVAEVMRISGLIPRLKTCANTDEALEVIGGATL